MKTKAIKAALLLGTMVAVASPAAAEFHDRTIRISNGVAENHPVHNGVDAMQQCLDDKTGGKMKLQAYWSGSLGGDLQATQALRSGTLDAVVTSSSPLVGIEPALGVFDLPFLFQTNEEAYAVMDGDFGKFLNDKLADKGLVNLAYWENGFRNVSNSKRPITKWEDLKGIKIRVMQNNIFLDTFDNLGANATPMAFGEVFSALETGAIDAQENPYVTIDTSKFYEVQKYISETKHAYTPFLFLFSKPIFDTFDPDEQDALRTCAVKGGSVERNVIQDLNKKSLEKMEKAGIKFNKVSPEELARMREKSQVVYDKHRDEIGGDVIDRVQKTIDGLRSEKKASSN
ncbi:MULTISPECIES: TRAP transporter substrate-binding protein [Thioclava]|uniref:TRAP transporter substrate-binding protein n=2 Tax=Thioclava TaxID=285107 RepID=A0ABX6YQH7_9RHOB|nr:MULTISPECIES: TRAP transporter substrate-binding protein [Thioclava]QPZ90069.1 TRAP transporter substrate-binding protein [Thioclava electrotropha]